MVLWLLGGVGGLKLVILVSTAVTLYLGISVAKKNGALYISHVERGRLAHVQGRAISSLTRLVLCKHLSSFTFTLGIPA